MTLIEFHSVERTVCLHENFSEMVVCMQSTQNVCSVVHSIRCVRKHSLLMKNLNYIFSVSVCVCARVPLNYFRVPSADCVHKRTKATINLFIFSLNAQKTENRST